MSNYLKINQIPIAADESPHETDTIEWWFVQGYYDGISSGRRYFMTSIFRNTLRPESSKHETGFSLLLSVLDPATLRHETLSQIDTSTLGAVTRLNKEARQINLDISMIDAYINETVAYGPPSPIHVSETSAKVTSNPLDISWNDFSLHQGEKSFQLTYSEPETRRNCIFNLHPLRDRIFIEKSRSPRFNAMAYATYPNLELTGYIDNEQARGEAWLDHQWGNAGGWFFTDPSKDKVLGWEWFGINLENGSVLLIMVHRDMETMLPVGQFALLQEKDKDPYMLQNFTIKPLRHWKSKKTHSNYPVAWHIEIQELEACLTFEPLADNQEIMVFGMTRAIWEGAGRVSGTIAGRPVCGRARLELNGYGYIFDFGQYIDDMARRIDTCIEKYFPKEIDGTQLQKYVGSPQWEHAPSAYTEILSKPIWDLLSRRGKHWRPIFGILLLEALGTPAEPYEMIASVIPELSHTGALIIDDIEDNSKIRRGDECIHLRYGLDTALNAANTLYFLPHLTIANHPRLTDEQRLAMYKIMVQRLVQAHFGQGLDIYWSRYMSVHNLTGWMEDSIGPKILQMYAFKTATAVEGTAEVVCIIARSDTDTREACLAFSRALGVAFQIIDDIHNFSDSPHWTKECGEDIATGKLTYVLFRTLERLKSSDRRRLQKILCSQKLRKNPSVLTEGIELVRRSGALESCRLEAKAMMDNAWAELSKKLPPSEPKIMLRMFCSHLLNIMYET